MTLSREQFLNQKRDYSDYLVHLTRRRNDASAVEVLAEIALSGRIEGRAPHCLFNSKLEEVPFDWARRRFDVACFSECPIEFGSDLVQPVIGRQVQLEPFGIVVAKDLVRQWNGNPVLYAGWPLTKAFLAIWQLLLDAGKIGDLADLMPFVSLASSRMDFHWEREWRVSKQLPINPGEVLMFLCPERDIPRFRELLNVGTDDEWLRVPVVDASWRPERIVAALSKQRDDWEPRAEPW